ncbi:hypothetical protein BQ8482_111786 [Mesorhizobium delmotii]|uniref:Uncharacterized protein n=1 Tax=Mesorhizobium delmotii TaxID=1631247 RepID=A0A2P9AFF0_9HYPH|nr:hypothetical protein BQ8482_111786 [Mesorhizobium delmotii]
MAPRCLLDPIGPMRRDGAAAPEDDIEIVFEKRGARSFRVVLMGCSQSHRHRAGQSIDKRNIPFSLPAMIGWIQEA